MIVPAKRGSKITRHAHLFFLQEGESRDPITLNSDTRGDRKVVPVVGGCERASIGTKHVQKTSSAEASSKETG